DRPVEDLQSGDEIFHTLYDIDDKMQIPGEQYVWSGRTYEKDGYQPKWRAIRDDKGRIVVAICHNMHLGDAWEWADDPNYPEPFVLLSPWPAWLLPVLIVVSAGGLALLVRRRMKDAAPTLRGWRAWAVWATQSAFIALVLLLLWQPAMTVAALSSQQNIIAVV